MTRDEIIQRAYPLKRLRDGRTFRFAWTQEAAANLGHYPFEKYPLPEGAAEFVLPDFDCDCRNATVWCWENREGKPWQAAIEAAVAAYKPPKPKASDFIGREIHDEHGPAKVICGEGVWVMARRNGRMPFVLNVNDIGKRWRIEP